jgi:photosystem II stability/assembly factor-like uncharacterized protein
MSRFVLLSLILASSLLADAPVLRVFNAGGSGAERLDAALPLSDGTILVAGSAESLDWVPASATKMELTLTAKNGWTLPKNEGELAGRTGFLMQLSADLGKVLHLLKLPAGHGGNIVALKTNSEPGAATQNIYVAGSNADGKRYWLGQLNANYLTAPATELVWGYDEHCADDKGIPIEHMWDVGGDGKVVFYYYKEAYYGAVLRLRADGSGLDEVPGWNCERDYMTPEGKGAGSLALKPGNNDLRSKTWAEYNALQPDGNGSVRKGSMPHDLFYACPVEAGNEKRGYTGYADKGTTATSFAVHVDRRSNAIYLGFNIQSILPPWAEIPNAPDFEPAVAAFDKDGKMRWWSRLYSETFAGQGPLWTQDGGSKWSPLGRGHVFGAVTAALKLKTCILAADSENGVVRMGASGQWTYSNKGLALPRVTNLSALPDAGVLAITADAKFYQSSDEGLSWMAHPASLPEKKGAKEVTAFGSMGSTWIAARSKGGVFVSANGGSSWKEVEGIKDRVWCFVPEPDHPTTWWAGTEKELLRSTDSGASWQKVMEADVRHLIYDPFTPGTLYCAVYDKRNKDKAGAHKSTDGGKSWQRLETGNAKPMCLAVPSEGTLLVGTEDRGTVVIKGSAKGESLKDLGFSAGSTRCLLVDPGNRSSVYAFSSGSARTSSPDQYVDGLAIDYSKPDGELVVFARSHGNQVSNLWSGKGSFHERFTGTNGNDHYQWIGRLRQGDGGFVNAAWFTGIDASKGGFGNPYDDANLDGWPSHNAGNMSLKGAQGRSFGVSAAGEPYAAGTTRAHVTTAKAFQKMTNPTQGKAPWNDFFRIYTADLSSLVYASALTNPGWDAEGQGGEATHITSMAPLPNGGYIVVGYHKGQGEATPTANVPAWGAAAPQGESLLIGMFPVH